MFDQFQKVQVGWSDGGLPTDVLNKWSGSGAALLRTHLTPGYVVHVRTWLTVDVSDALGMIVRLNAFRRDILMDDVARG